MPRTDNILSEKRPDLAKEWDYSKNEMTPDKYALYSNKKVWWMCDKGHIWKRRISSQVKSNICPICSETILKPYENDIEITNPDIAKEWDYEKNKPLTPHDFMGSSQAKVWWICSSCGNNWRTEIRSRVKKHTGCPKCGTAKMRSTRAENANRLQKSLADLYPEICREWDYEKNKNVNPKELSYGSNYKAWWICSRGHSYQAWINDRTGKRRTGCPTCSYIAKSKKVMCLETLEVYESTREAAYAIGKSPGSISRCARGDTKTCGGYHWKYVK